MSKVLNTPFGKLLIKINGKEQVYNYSESSKSYWGKSETVYSINYDLSNLKIGDKIIIEIENRRLEYLESDERCDTLSIENESKILAMCGYEPQYHEGEREYHCYELDDFMSGNFEYSIKREPSKYITEFPESHIIRMNICWINKTDFDDYDTAIDLLTWF